MTAEDQIENLMLSIAKKSVLKTLCPYSSFDVQFPKLAFCQLNYSRSADALNISKTVLCAPDQNGSA